MGRKIPHLQLRDGRYYARVVVPQHIRHIIGVNELRTPLGPDLRRAKDILPAAIAEHKRRIHAARIKLEDAANRISARQITPLSPEALGQLHYQQLLDFDMMQRNTSPAWASVPIDDSYVIKLREAAAGKLTNTEMAALMLHALPSLSQGGLIDDNVQSADWRQSGRALASAELAALDVIMRRDDGEFDELSTQPASEPVSKQAEAQEPVSLQRLFESYIKELERSNAGAGAKKRWAPVFPHLVEYLRRKRGLSARETWQADDATRVSKKELVEWKEELLETKTPKTVRDVWVCAVRAVLNRAVADDLLVENVAASIKVKVPKAIRTREKGFTDDEAEAILKATFHYQPANRENPAQRELPQMVSAKRWLPILCAFTGSRISEMAQLRKEDVRTEGNVLVIRINPEAGTVKTRQYRDVPAHRQLLDLGFAEFVAASPDGPLFHRLGTKAETVSDRLCKWLRAEGLAPANVQPNYGWRHRFKTQAIQLGIDPRIRDAMQGHSARTAGEDYGDVTIKAMALALNKFPKYRL